MDTKKLNLINAEYKAKRLFKTAEDKLTTAEFYAFINILPKARDGSMDQISPAT